MYYKRGAPVNRFPTTRACYQCPTDLRAGTLFLVDVVADPRTACDEIHVAAALTEGLHYALFFSHDPLAAFLALRRLMVLGYISRACVAEMAA